MGGMRRTEDERRGAVDGPKARLERMRAMRCDEDTMLNAMRMEARRENHHSDR